MITPPPGALLQFSYGMVAPRIIDEVLAIYPDGQCWHWVLAGSTGFDRVGSYRIELNPNDLVEAKRIAADLLRQTPPPPPSVPSGAELVILAGIDGTQRRHILYECDPKSPAAFNPARQFAQRIRKAVNRVPLSTLIMTLQARFPAGIAKGSLSYIFDNTGNEPIGLRFHDSAFRLQVSDKNGAHLQSWSSDEGLVGGLTDGQMNYLDGVFAAAVIQPRTRAALAFVDAIQPPQQRGARLTARTSGVLTLIYPGIQPEDPYPGDEFHLETTISL